MQPVWGLHTSFKRKWAKNPSSNNFPPTTWKCQLILLRVLDEPRSWLYCQLTKPFSFFNSFYFHQSNMYAWLQKIKSIWTVPHHENLPSQQCLSLDASQHGSGLWEVGSTHPLTSHSFDLEPGKGDLRFVAQVEARRLLLTAGQWASRQWPFLQPSMGPSKQTQPLHVSLRFLELQLVLKLLSA